MRSSVKPLRPILNAGHPLARGLVCAMPFMEHGGTAIRDLTKRRTGVPTNQTLSTFWARGAYGIEAVQPDAADGDTAPWIAIPDDADISPGANNFTVSFLCRPASLTGVNRALFNNYEASLNGLVFLNISTANVFSFTVRDTDGDDAVAVSSLALAANAYYLVHGVRRGATVELYVNGVVTGSDTDAALGAVTTTGGRAPMIGAFNNGVTPIQRFVWYGAIADFRWWARALSAREIASHWSDMWGLYRAPSASVFSASTPQITVPASYVTRLPVGLTGGMRG